MRHTIFNGLSPPEDNVKLLLLLYRLAEWHTFAELRMQTEPTIVHLEKFTAELGRVTHDFKQKVCAKYNTFELQRETAAEDERNAVLNLCLHPHL